MNKGLKIGLLVLPLIIVFSIVGLTIVKLMDKPEITEAEAKTRVEKVYSGEIKNVISRENGYLITFEKSDGIYEVFINNINGNFSSLTLISENQSVIANEPKNKNISNNNSQKEKIDTSNNQTSMGKPVILSEKEVAEIALKEFSGEVEDIDYFEADDGGYFLVEVDNGEEEAELQIHAVTGKILSVKFDD